LSGKDSTSNPFGMTQVYQYIDTHTCVSPKSLKRKNKAFWSSIFIIPLAIRNTLLALD